MRENLGRIPIFIAISAVCAMLLSSSFVLQINQAAWAGTFPGENGKIAFISDRDVYQQIYAVNADGTNPTRLTNNPAPDGEPRWSPDGEKIAFHSSRDSTSVTSVNDEIYVMNADGTNPTRLTNNPAPDEEPDWSPDGEKIAFQREFSHEDDPLDDSINIYVMNADGSGQTSLTNRITFDRSPSWSPDGTKIAFSRDFDIYVMNAADGSGQTRLTSGLEPSWSPDGTKIAFHSGNEIYVMNADGTNPTRLTNNRVIDGDPSWSPDGTKIAFTSNRDRQLEIYVMNAADGSGQTNISNNPARDFAPDWGTAKATEPPPEEDTTPPVLTVPDDMVVEATSEQGAQVTYTVTAQDNVDGNATLEEDGSTVTQDEIGGDIDISCEPASGTRFPIGETTVECSATDEAGNTGTALFTVTVNPPSPLTPAQEAIDELISTIQNLEGVPLGVKTSLIAVLNEVSNILNDNNPDNDESVCRTLDGFINQVNANETSDTLTADEADELSTQSEEIRNALDC